MAAVNTTATVQKLYAAAALQMMSTLEGGDLKNLGEKKTQTGGDSCTFYRKKAAAAKDGVPSMFGSDWEAGGGDFANYTATISQVSVQEKIKKVDMLKTKIDIKAPIIKSMGIAMKLKEDEKIIAAIKAADSNLNKAGAAELDPTTLDCARALVAEIRDCHVSAEMTPDGKKGVAVVMNREDYKRLATSDAFINGDYRDAIKGGDGVLPLSMVGATLVISPTVTSGEIYIIPSNTFGYAEWEGTAEASAEYFATDAQQWHLQMVKSVGVVIIETNYITKFSIKPTESARPAAVNLAETQATTQRTKISAV